MDYEKTEQWAEGLLTVALVSKEGEEHNIWLLLRHLFIAVKIHDDLQPEEKKKVQQIIKMTKGMFFSRFNVKETKKKKREIEKNTPTPSRKEKEEKEKDREKTLSQEKEILLSNFEEREKAFKNACMALKDRFDIGIINDFYYYWSLPNKQKTRMRYERRTYFDIEKMLTRWAKNHFASDNTAAAIRLDETKKRQSKEAKSLEKQQVVAAARVEADTKWEQEMAETKRNAVSYEEYQNMKKQGKI